VFHLDLEKVVGGRALLRNGAWYFLFSSHGFDFWNPGVKLVLETVHCKLQDLGTGQALVFMVIYTPYYFLI
jgi:hypothetical protein